MNWMHSLILHEALPVKGGPKDAGCGCSPKARPRCTTQQGEAGGLEAEDL